MVAGSAGLLVYVRVGVLDCGIGPMALTLRPYQEDIIQDARRELATHESVLIVAPTGSGICD